MESRKELLLSLERFKEHLNLKQHEGTGKRG
jgi:hypothetical protein